MGNNKYIFWQAMGVALTVPAVTTLLSSPQVDSNTSIISFVFGCLCIFIGIALDYFVNRDLARKGEAKKASYGLLLMPLYMDLGANFFVAGLFVEPSVLKVFLLIGGVLLIEVFLLILVSKFLQ
jgi:hypothetical protein